MESPGARRIPSWRSHYRRLRNWRIVGVDRSFGEDAGWLRRSTSGSPALRARRPAGSPRKSFSLERRRPAAHRRAEHQLHGQARPVALFAAQAAHIRRENESGLSRRRSAAGEFQTDERAQAAAFLGGDREAAAQIVRPAADEPDGRNRTHYPPFGRAPWPSAVTGVALALLPVAFCPGSERTASAPVTPDPLADDARRRRSAGDPAESDSSRRPSASSRCLSRPEEFVVPIPARRGATLRKRELAAFEQEATTPRAGITRPARFASAGVITPKIALAARRSRDALVGFDVPDFRQRCARGSGAARSARCDAGLRAPLARFPQRIRRGLRERDT